MAVAAAGAATGRPHLALLIPVAATGAYAGDLIAYHIGGRGGARLHRRLHAHARGRAAYRWAQTTMHQRGPLLLLLARYLPFGRSATALAAGAVGYPARRFGAWTAVAVLIWATFAALAGHWGGTAYADEPWKGILVAYATITAGLATAEATRRIATTRRRKPGQEG